MGRNLQVVNGVKLMITAELTGLGLTSTVNADGLLSFQSAGWGRNTWNDGPFGDSNDPVVTYNWIWFNFICW